MRRGPILAIAIASVAAATAGGAGGAASSRRPGPIAYAHAFNGIYLMDPDGSHKHRISPKGARDFDPAFSPSGTRLAYATGGPAQGGIAIMHRNGSHRRRLAKGGYAPSFAPGGGRLAFDAFHGNSNADIYTMGTNGKHVRRLTTSHGYEEDPSWSPSGRLIAFDGDDGGLPNFGVFVMRNDGSHRKLLDRNASTPSFSPDGRNIVYGGTDSAGLGQLMTIHPNGTHRRQLTENTGGRIEYDNPHYSPNGKRIVFTRFVSYRNSDSTDLFQVRADGSQLERLTHGGVSAAPSWGVEPR